MSGVLVEVFGDVLGYLFKHDSQGAPELVSDSVYGTLRPTGAHSIKL